MNLSVRLIGNLIIRRNILATTTTRLYNYSSLILATNNNNNNNILIGVPNVLLLKNYYSKKAKKDDKSSLKKPKVQLNKEELNSIINFDEFVSSMNKVVNDLKEEYAKNLSLRFNPNSIEEIQVKTPDGTFKIGEIGQLNAKNAQLFVLDMINSPQYITKVVEAINKSGLHLNPQIDKTSIFLNLPKLSREHRENLVKSAKKMFENSSVKLRELNKKYSRKVSESKTASTDLIFQTNETIKFEYARHVKEAEKIRDTKQAELLE